MFEIRQHAISPTHEHLNRMFDLHFQTDRAMWRPQTPRARRLASRAGFTLVELMVTIAVVATLAFIAFTAAGAASRAAKSAKATSNLRQIGVLVGSYATENNNRLPFYIDWGSYFGNPPGLVFFQRTLAENAGFGFAQSPQSATRPLPDFFYDPCLDGGSLPQHPMGSFGVNAAILPDAEECRLRFGSKQGVPLSILSDPSRKVICCSVVEPNWSGGWAFDGRVFAQNGYDPKSGPQPRNAGRAASLFADGHVEKLDVKNMDQAQRRRYFTLDP